MPRSVAQPSAVSPMQLDAPGSWGELPGERIRAEDRERVIDVDVGDRSSGLDAAFLATPVARALDIAAQATILMKRPIG